MSDEHRTSDRINLPGALVGEVMIYQPTAIRELSVGGMQVETHFPLQLDSLHDFRLTVGERSVVVKGRVAHSHIAEFEPHEGVIYRSGVEFIELPKRVEEVIASFVEHLRHV